MPVTLAAGLDLGWTNQITGGSAMAAEVEFGLLFRPGPLRLGLLGHLGLRGELASFGVDVAAGPSFAPQPGTRIDVLALLGLQGFVRSDSSSFLGQRTVTGGSATLPAAGLRVVSGPEDGRGLSLGLQAQLLLGTDRGTYTTRDCFLFGCTETVHPYRFDGVMVGLILQYGNTFRSPPAAPGASPTPPGTPEPPPATRWNGGAP